jgi:hypothetical protein
MPEEKAMRGFARFPWRCGNHHAGRRAAMRAAVIAALLLLPGTLWAQSEGYAQRGIPAEATAENAVVARDRALAAGRRAAWERLSAQLGSSRTLSDAQIEAMVDSIIIEQERTTPTRYAGRITVNFNPGRVRGATGASLPSGGGGTPGDAPAPQPPPPGVAGLVPSGPAQATIEARARYASLSEWLELRRRLAGAAAVASVQVLGISTDAARLRLGLRAPPAVAAEDLLRTGVALGMAAPAPGASPEGWQVGLAGGY